MLVATPNVFMRSYGLNKSASSSRACPPVHVHVAGLKDAAVRRQHAGAHWKRTQLLPRCIATQAQEKAASQPVPASTTPDAPRPARGMPDWLKSAAKGAAVLGLAVALVLGRCMPAEAARSAGRAGGFAGRSGGASRSYSSPSRSGGYSGGYNSGYSSFGGMGGYGYGYPSRSIIVAPPLMGPSVVVAPGSAYGPSVGVGMTTTAAGSLLADSLMFFVLLSFGTLAVTTAMGGTSDGLKGFAGKPTLTKVQVGLVSSARKLKKKLDVIAANADSDTPEGLQCLLQDVVLALLRNPAYWVYGAASETPCSSDSDVERRFNSASVAERSKFAQETLVNVRGGGSRLRSSFNLANSGSSSSSSAPDEIIVVTLLVATRGPVDLPSRVDSSESMVDTLKALGALRAEDVMGVELLWTPQAEGDYYTRDEVMVDYPKLKVL